MSSILTPLSLNLSLLLTLFLTSTHAVTFEVVNQCTYTVWAAATPRGGQRLDPGQAWILSVAPGTPSGHIWGRTNCSFNAEGQGQCETGDCSQLLECQVSGSPPNTLVEFTLERGNSSNQDSLDISLIDGFNIPIGLRPTTGACRGIRCSDDINSRCLEQLKAPGGCNHPCTVFKTSEYCCTSGPDSCGSTAYSQFFKDRCPDAYTYVYDDPSCTFKCPDSINYKVTFCP